MEHYRLLERTEFSEGTERGHAVALHPSAESRTLLFALREGQVVKQHATRFPMHVIVLQGSGEFVVQETTEEAGRGSLLVVEAGETIEAKAVGGQLVFLAVLRRAEGSAGDNP